MYSVLHQLCIASQSLLRFALKKYHIKKDKFITDFEAVWNVFNAAVDSNSCGDVICVLDGLEKCDEGSRNLLINGLG